MGRPKKDHISLKKNRNGTFTIIRDEHFAKLMAVSFTFHSKYMESVSIEKGHSMQESPKFLLLMERISEEQESIELVISDLKILHEWVKCITEIILVLPNTDLTTPNMLTFFRLAEDFVKRTEKVLELL
jgi:hypothetical protein